MREKQEHIEKLPSSVKAFSAEATLVALAYLDELRQDCLGRSGAHRPGTDFQKKISVCSSVTTRGSKWFYANALREAGNIPGSTSDRLKVTYRVNETVYRLLQNHLDLQQSIAVKHGLDKPDPLADHVVERLSSDAFDNLLKQAQIALRVREQERDRCAKHAAALEHINNLKTEIAKIAVLEKQAKLDLNTARQYWRRLGKDLRVFQEALASAESAL